MRRSTAAAWACCALWTGHALGADNYTASYPGGNRATVDIGSSTLVGLFGGIGGVAIPPTLPIAFDLSLRGVPANLSGVAVNLGNAPAISGQLQIPSTGTNATFAATTWPAVLEQVRRFLLQGTEARRLQRESARSSPFDPVAGNPGSLMARVVASDFASGFTPFASNLTDGPVRLAQVGGVPAGAVRGPLPALPGIGAQLGLLRDAGLGQRSLTVPLSLTLRSDLDPRRQFSVSLPLTLTDSEGARSVQGTLGAALRQPINREWALSGSLAYSVVSAKDLGSAGKIASLSVTSSYVIRGASSDLGLGNMIGIYRTLGGTLSGIDTGSGVSNTVLRNGVLWSMPAPAGLGFGRSIEYTFVNTHYLGSDLYLRNYSELGVAVGTNKRADSTRSYMQGGLSLLLSARTKGVMAHFGYWF